MSKSVNPSETGMTSKERHVLFITDNLDDYSSLIRFDIKLQNFNFYVLAFAELPMVLEQFDPLEIQRDRVIIMMDWDFVDNEILEKITTLFSDFFNSAMPHMIFFLKERFDIFKDCVIFKSNNHFYILPELANADPNVYTNNLVIYINTIFQLLIDREKMDGYIIDSFKTIADIIVDNEVIKKQKHEIEELNIKLSEMTKIDFLTRILNRRAFFQLLEKERKRTIRSIIKISKDNELIREGMQVGKGIFATLKDNKIFHHIVKQYGYFCCILIDIDHFKEVNDTKGHLVGDHVLQKLGELFLSRDYIRETDAVGRYGGEEFIILLPETNIDGAVILANRLLEKIRSQPFADSSGTVFHITVSMGISEFRITDESNDDLVRRTDEALYYAKNNGRNQIAVYEEIAERDRLARP